MQIQATDQSHDGPSNKPQVDTPVLAKLDIPLFYATERGPIPWQHSVFCGKAFAETVLTECEKLFQDNNYGLVHIGVYNPRQARHKDGTPIIPIRWSNHAYGEAMDFKGVYTDNGNGEFLGIARMKAEIPGFLNSLHTACETAVTAINRKPEIVDEGDWLHLGIWPSR
ncbi:hypothetical protein [Methylomonas albis]|uniref:Uncharacterized protein n=1 Tax=Methylomonas albis TaxID=1854563 RepID=A0ABR9D673_9GAMM|nr:hypothetical protein [Methylomonas albis]MBD9358619.1 hypothetical protein [Methylomonas albis]